MREEFHHLLRDAHADNFLRLLGGAADVRRGQHAIHGEQREARGRRLHAEDIQRGIGHLAAGESFGQRGFVHQFAARAVDDAHAVFHLGERLAGEHALRLRRGRHVQRQVVGGRVELRQVEQFHAEIVRDGGGDVRVVRHDAHLEGARAFHHFAPDAAQADDAERLAAQLVAHEFFLFPLAAARGRVGLGNVPRHGQHHGERVLGHRDGVAARRVHHQHAGLGGGFEIDVVHADPRAPDHAQLGRLLQHGLGDLHGGAHQQRVGVRQVLRVFLRIRNNHVPAGLGLKQLDPGRREGLGDQDVHFFTAACAYTSCAAETPVPYFTGCPLALRMISRQAIMANRSAKSK